MEELAYSLLENPELKLDGLAQQRLQSVLAGAESAYAKQCKSSWGAHMDFQASDTEAYGRRGLQKPELSFTELQQQRACTEYICRVFGSFLQSYAATSTPLKSLRSAELWLYSHLLHQVFKTKWDHGWSVLPAWTALTKAAGDAVVLSPEWQVYIKQVAQRPKEQPSDGKGLPEGTGADASAEQHLLPIIREELLRSLDGLWCKRLVRPPNLLAEAASAINRVVERTVKRFDQISPESFDQQTVDETILSIQLALQPLTSSVLFPAPHLCAWPLDLALLTFWEKLFIDSWDKHCDSFPEARNATPYWQAEYCFCLRSPKRLAAIENVIRSAQERIRQHGITKLNPKPPPFDFSTLPYWGHPDPTYYFERTTIPGLRREDRRQVHCRLLEIHAEHLESSEPSFFGMPLFRNAFDCFAKAFLNSSILSEESIQNRIPHLTFDAFVCGRWSRAPVSLPMPNEEYVIQLGQEWTSDWWRKHLYAVIEGRIVFWKSQVLESKPIAPKVSTKPRTKPGPRPNLDVYKTVRRAVEEEAGLEHWKEAEKLVAICLRLDDEGVPIVKSWRRRHNCNDWTDALATCRENVLKAIQYRLAKTKTSPN